jgi:hypothetical protein
LLYRYSLSEYNKYFNTEIEKQKEASRGAMKKQAETKMDFISIVEPIPLKFELDSDETDPDKSPFEYVFCYALILYTEMGDGCEEIEVEKMRPRAKKMVCDIIKEASKVIKEVDEDDSEEEIITTAKSTKTKDSVPQHEDISMNTNIIDNLVSLRENIKKSPKSFELIK